MENNEKEEKMGYYEAFAELLKGNRSDEVCAIISRAISKAMTLDMIEKKIDDALERISLEHDECDDGKGNDA